MSEKVLGNFVALSEGIAKRLKFTDHVIGPKLITDPMTHQPKVTNTLTFSVIEEDGLPIAKIYSVTSEKHAQQFAPFLAGKTYIGKTFSITARGRGYLREYTVQVLPG